MVTVGIDPHKHVHVAVAVGDDGRPVGKPLTVRNDALLIPTCAEVDPVGRRRHRHLGH